MHKLNSQFGFGARNRQIQYEETDYREASPGDVTSYTYTAVALGREDVSRVIVVGVAASDWDLVTVNDVTVTLGGDDMVRCSNGATAKATINWYYLHYPSSTSADIEVTYDALKSRFTMVTYALTGFGEIALFDANLSKVQSGGPETLEVDSIAGGIVFAGGSVYKNSGAAITDMSIDSGAIETHSQAPTTKIAFVWGETPGTGETISVDFSTDDDPVTQFTTSLACFYVK